MDPQSAPPHPAGPPSEDLSPRNLALKALVRLEGPEARTRDLIDEALRHAASAGRPLNQEDQGLLAELVHGTLRHRGRLDYYLSRVSHRPLEQLSPWVRNLLRLALYQVLELDRIPHGAALDTAAEIARAQGNEGAVKFVNGCLRELCRLKEEAKLPPPPLDPVAALSVSKSHPLWMARRLVELYGFDRAASVFDASFTAPPLTLRVNALLTRRDDLGGRLHKAGFQVEACRFSPWGLRVKQAADIRRMPGFHEGHFSVQDESSQLLGRLLSYTPGFQAADICAAPGGKAAHLAELAGPQGQVWAFDRKPQALDKMAQGLRRLQLPQLAFEARDALSPRPDLQGHLDAVLVDAPCSALGVLRRRAESRWQAKPEAAAAHASRQLRMLQASASYLRPGGVLIYATCTLEEAENEDVVRAFLEARDDFAFERASNFLERELCTTEGFYRAWPGQDGMDGFFAARLRKVR